MIVLDAYPLAALLAGEPAATEVRELITNDPPFVPAPNLAEAIDLVGRTYGVEAQSARAAIESLQESTDLKILPVHERHAWRAAELRVTYYHRTRRPVSIADCLLLAVTSSDDRVATADRHVLAVAHAEGINWIALPDSKGQRHPPS